MPEIVTEMYGNPGPKGAVWTRRCTNPGCWATVVPFGVDPESFEPISHHPSCPRVRELPNNLPSEAE